MERVSYSRWKDETVERWQRRITSPRLRHRLGWSWAAFAGLDGDSFDVRVQLTNIDDERRVKDTVEQALRRRLHSTVAPKQEVVGILLHAMTDGERWRVCVNNAPGDAPQDVPRVARPAFVARALTYLSGTPVHSVMPLARYSLQVHADGQVRDTFQLLDPRTSESALCVALADRLAQTRLMSKHASGLEGSIYPDGEIRWSVSTGHAESRRRHTLRSSELVDATVARLLRNGAGANG